MNGPFAVTIVLGAVEKEGGGDWMRVLAVSSRETPIAVIDVRLEDAAAGDGAIKSTLAVVHHELSRAFAARRGA